MHLLLPYHFLCSECCRYSSSLARNHSLADTPCNGILGVPVLRAAGVLGAINCCAIAPPAALPHVFSCSSRCLPSCCPPPLSHPLKRRLPQCQPPRRCPPCCHFLRHNPPKHRPPAATATPLVALLPAALLAVALPQHRTSHCWPTWCHPSHRAPPSAAKYHLP